MKLSLGYLTAATKAEARAIVQELLAEGLIACANIIPNVESHFVWEKKLTKTSEVVVIIKTRTANEDKIIKRVSKMHSYDCPCVVFVSLDYGHMEFLRWIEKNS